MLTHNAFYKPQLINPFGRDYKNAQHQSGIFVTPNFLPVHVMNLSWTPSEMCSGTLFTERIQIDGRPDRFKFHGVLLLQTYIGCRDGNKNIKMRGVDMNQALHSIASYTQWISMVMWNCSPIQLIGKTERIVALPDTSAATKIVAAKTLKSSCDVNAMTCESRIDQRVMLYKPDQLEMNSLLRIAPRWIRLAKLCANQYDGVKNCATRVASENTTSTCCKPACRRRSKRVMFVSDIAEEHQHCWSHSSRLAVW